MKRHVTRRRVAIAIAILLLLWWFWPGDSLAHIRDMQQQLFSEAGRAMSPDERRAAFNELRAAMAKLTPEQRGKLADDRQKRFEKRMNDYFALTPAEKKSYLDQQINQAQQAPPQGTNAAGPPSGGFGPGNQGNSMTAEQKEKRRQDRLDSTSPQFRAQMDQFRRDMTQRRQERGLPPATRRR